MRRNRWAELSAWVLACLDAAKLSQEWHLEISRDPASDDAEAEISKTESLGACLKVSAEFWDYSPVNQRRIIAHELCHLVLYRIDECTEAAEDVLDEKALKVWSRAHSNACEYTTERIARILAEALPMPRLPR